MQPLPYSLMIKVAKQVQHGLRAVHCELHVHPHGWFVFFDDPEIAARSVCISADRCRAYIDGGDGEPVPVGDPANVDAIYAWLVDGTTPAGAEA